MADMSSHEYSESMRKLTREALAQIEMPGAFLGQKKVLAVDPLSAPQKTEKAEKTEKTSKRPAPFCHSSCVNLRRLFCEAYREFVGQYREALAAIHQGVLARFPPGGLVHLSWSLHSAAPG